MNKYKNTAVLEIKRHSGIINKTTTAIIRIAIAINRGNIWT